MYTCILIASYHRIYRLISDVGAYVWFMDMDPHSLAPPYFAADVGADLASQTDLGSVLASFPGPLRGRRKGLVHSLRMRQFFRKNVRKGVRTLILTTC
jgi:hypothetical protein